MTENSNSRCLEKIEAYFSYKLSLELKIQGRYGHLTNHPSSIFLLCCHHMWFPPHGSLWLLEHQPLCLHSCQQNGKRPEKVGPPLFRDYLGTFLRVSQETSAYIFVRTSLLAAREAGKCKLGSPEPSWRLGVLLLRKKRTHIKGPKQSQPEYKKFSTNFLNKQLWWTHCFAFSEVFLSTHFFLIFFWLSWVFVAARRLSLVASSGGYSSSWCAGFSLWWLLLLRSTGSRRAGFSSWGSRALECKRSSCGARA